MYTKPVRQALLITVSLSLPLLPVSNARADDLTWRGVAGSFWDANTGGLFPQPNWFPFAIAGAGDDVFFTESGTTNVVNLNGDRTVNSVTFEGANDYSLRNNTLTLQSGTITASGASSFTISSRIHLDNHALWDIGGDSFLSAGNITVATPTTTLTKLGAGTLFLSSINSQAGTSVINGDLFVSSDAALGAVGAPLKLADGTAFRTPSRDITFDADRTLTLVSGQAEFDVNGINAQYQWAGAIDGAGGIVKVGDGPLAITSATPNTNAGLTTVAEGILSLETPAGVPAFGGDLAAIGGGQLLFNSDNQTTGLNGLTITGGFAELNGTTQRFKKVIVSSPSQLQMRDATVHADTFEPTAGTLFFSSTRTFGANISTNRVIGSVSLDSGTFSPGDGIGSATIEGDFGMTFGTLAIALAGTTPGLNHDQLIVQGAIDTRPNPSFQNLSILDIRLDHGFAPSAGDSFDILDFTNFINTFNTINLPNLDTGLAWDDSQLYTDGSLSVILDLILGDLNGDGVLTNGDIAPFVQALTDPAGYEAAFPSLDPDLLGDFTGDGQLTNGDIAGFVAALTGNGVNSAPVPEPASLALLGLGGLVAMRRGRSGTGR